MARAEALLLAEKRAKCCHGRATSLKKSTLRRRPHSSPPRRPPHRLLVAVVHGPDRGRSCTLAQATAEEEQVHVKLDMSRSELGGLEIRWKAVEREAGHGERYIKKMQAEVESPREKVDATGLSA